MAYGGYGRRQDFLRDEETLRKSQSEMFSERLRQNKQYIDAKRERKRQEAQRKKGGMWKSILGIGGTILGGAAGALLAPVTGGASIGMGALLGSSLGGGVGGAVGDVVAGGYTGDYGDPAGKLMAGASPALSYMAMESLRNRYRPEPPRGGLRPQIQSMPPQDDYMSRLRPRSGSI